MGTTVGYAEIFTTVDIPDIPSGDYPGVWGGYEVTVMIGGAQYRLKTRDGIRTPRADCIVKVYNGSITVETT